MSRLKVSLIKSTKDDVRKLFLAIEQELRVAKTKFQNHKKRQFKFES